MQISTKCSVAIHCLIFIYEYGEKKKVTSELLSLSTGINPVTIRTVFSALKKEGIISVRTGTGGATLNCPPNEISLHQVCKAMEPDFPSKMIGIHPLPSPLCPVGRNIHSVLDASYQKVRDDLCSSLRSITLEDVLADYHRLIPG